MSTPQIVKLNVTQTQAPLPNNLQQTGLIVSAGGTSVPTGTTILLTQVADLLAVLDAVVVPISTAVWAAGVVTVTTSTAHGLTVGEDGQLASVVGMTPAGYNGMRVVSVPTATTFTFPLTVTPGLASIMGTAVKGDIEVLAQVTTYFSQGSDVAVYLLELGSTASAAAGIAALTTFLQLNLSTYYAVLLPRGYGNEATLLPLIASQEFLTAKIYFFITVGVASYTSYTPLMKCAVCLIEAPGIPGLEFTIAAMFYQFISQMPSNVQRVAPFCYRFAYGVTPYPVKANQAFLVGLKAANVNYIALASEGGITNAMVYPGTTMDGRDLIYWYSVDWVEINMELDLANEIINGSNNQINPLYYDQPGVDRLQARAQQTMVRAVTFGLALAPVRVDAIGFQAYSLANPSDFRTGVYNGLSTTYTPNRGFQQITFNVNVTDFPAAA